MTAYTITQPGTLQRQHAAARRDHNATTVEEKSQILEWVLAVEKVGGVAGFERVTQTGEDWVVAHRGSVPPVPPSVTRTLQRR